MRAGIRLFISAVLLLLSVSAYAQSSKPSKLQKKADQKKAKQEQVLIKKEEKARKRHTKIQTKDTRKRMKTNKRRANRFNKNQGSESFFRRIFRQKN